MVVKNFEKFDENFQMNSSIMKEILAAIPDVITNEKRSEIVKNAIDTQRAAVKGDTFSLQKIRQNFTFQLFPQVVFLHKERIEQYRKIQHIFYENNNSNKNFRNKIFSEEYFINNDFLINPEVTNDHNLISYEFSNTPFFQIYTTAFVQCIETLYNETENKNFVKIFVNLENFRTQVFSALYYYKYNDQFVDNMSGFDKYDNTDVFCLWKEILLQTNTICCYSVSESRYVDVSCSHFSFSEEAVNYFVQKFVGDTHNDTISNIVHDLGNKISRRLKNVDAHDICLSMNFRNVFKEYMKNIPDNQAFFLIVRDSSGAFRDPCIYYYILGTPSKSLDMNKMTERVLTYRTNNKNIDNAQTNATNNIVFSTGNIMPIDNDGKIPVQEIFDDIADAFSAIYYYHLHSKTERTQFLKSLTEDVYTEKLFHKNLFVEDLYSTNSENRFCALTIANHVFNKYMWKDPHVFERKFPELFEDDMIFDVSEKVYTNCFPYLQNMKNLVVLLEDSEKNLTTMMNKEFHENENLSLFMQQYPVMPDGMNISFIMEKFIEFLQKTDMDNEKFVAIIMDNIAKMTKDTDDVYVQIWEEAHSGECFLF